VFHVLLTFVFHAVLQAAKNDDTADHAIPVKGSDRAESVSVKTEALVDKSDSPCDVKIKRDNAKLLFGNGRLDRWLSTHRRAFNQRPKLNTLDGWLSPSKTDTLSPKQSPLFARTRSASPEKSPVALRRKSTSVSICLDFSDPPQSTAWDIRKFFHSRSVPQPVLEKERGQLKSDSEAESQLDTVTMVDLVGDCLPSMSLEHSSEPGDGMSSLRCETVAVPADAAVQASSPQHNDSSSTHKTVDSKSHLDWWATSRTKSSTRKGPFKRSLGLVHFLKEVRFS